MILILITFLLSVLVGICAATIESIVAGVCMFGVSSLIGISIVLAISIALGRTAPEELECTETYKIVSLDDNRVIIDCGQGWHYTISRDSPNLITEYVGNVMPSLEVFHYRMGGWQKYWLLPCYDYPTKTVLYI